MTHIPLYTRMSAIPGKLFTQTVQALQTYTERQRNLSGTKRQQSNSLARTFASRGHIGYSLRAMETEGSRLEKYPLGFLTNVWQGLAYPIPAEFFLLGKFKPMERDFVLGGLGLKGGEFNNSLIHTIPLEDIIGHMAVEGLEAVNMERKESGMPNYRVAESTCADLQSHDAAYLMQKIAKTEDKTTLAAIGRAARDRGYDDVTETVREVFRARQAQRARPPAARVVTLKTRKQEPEKEVIPAQTSLDLPNTE
ncbi:hypothetical protein ACFL1B_00375 [Nanoarchaeota archaeon]